MGILIKPCFIFDLFCYSEQRYLHYNNYFFDAQSKVISDVNLKLSTFNLEKFDCDKVGMSILCLLFSNYKYHKHLEDMDTDDLIDIFSNPKQFHREVISRFNKEWFAYQYIEEALVFLEEGGAEMYLTFLKALKEINFYEFWQNEILPIVMGSCKRVISELSEVNTNSILERISILKADKIEEAKIYLCFFNNPVQFSLAQNAFLASCEFNSKKYLRIFIHELIHGFGSNQLDKYYKMIKDKDIFFGRTYKTLTEKWQSSSEEEFTVAAEAYVSIKEGVMTLDEALSYVMKNYGGCQPLAVITLDFLLKENKTPFNYNHWLIELFKEKKFRIGYIDKQVEEICPGFVKNYEMNL